MSEDEPVIDVHRKTRRFQVFILDNGKVELVYIDDAHKSERSTFVIHQDDVRDLKFALNTMGGI